MFMKTATLALLVRAFSPPSQKNASPWEFESVLLGLKGKKLGKQKYNGVGGMKEESDKTIEDAMVRELFEETGGKLNNGYGVRALEYRKAGEIAYTFPASPEWNQVVHVYLVTKWEGKACDTDEMSQFQWFYPGDVPYAKMWDNDRLWLPHVLGGKLIKGSVEHDGSNTLKHDIRVVENF